MTALAFAAGMAAGLSIALIAHAMQAAKRDRDQQALRNHLAMVRALSTLSGAHPDTPR